MASQTDLQAADTFPHKRGQIAKKVVVMYYSTLQSSNDEYVRMGSHSLASNTMDSAARKRYKMDWHI